MLDKLKRLFRSKEDITWEMAAMSFKASHDELWDMFTAEVAANAWRRVDQELPPANVWVLTKREGEDGWNVCCQVRHDEDTVEWIEKGSGRTTVTHHSFVGPTHWKPVNL